jgi:dipeptide/tripeptide permease
VRPQDPQDDRPPREPVRRDDVASPASVAVTATVPTPDEQAKWRWTGEALTLVGIWYGSLVAILGVVAATLGKAWAFGYAAVALAAGVMIFSVLRSQVMGLMKSYLDSAWLARPKNRD